MFRDAHYTLRHVCKSISRRHSNTLCALTCCSKDEEDARHNWIWNWTNGIAHTRCKEEEEETTQRKRRNKKPDHSVKRCESFKSTDAQHTHTHRTQKIKSKIIGIEMTGRGSCHGRNVTEKRRNIRRCLHVAVVARPKEMLIIANVNTPNMCWHSTRAKQNRVECACAHTMPGQMSDGHNCCHGFYRAELKRHTHTRITVMVMMCNRMGIFLISTRRQHIVALQL